MGTFSFSIPDLPVGVYYYLISESPNPDSSGLWVYDDTAYVVKVTVFGKANGELDYSITIYVDGEPVDDLQFTNSYNITPGTLSIFKYVEDTTDEEAFTFTVTQGVNPVDLTTAGISVGKSGSNGTYVATDLENGTFTMTRNTTVRIDGLAAGEYTITEIARGYATSYLVNGGSRQDGAVATVIVPVGGKANVDFVNEKIIVDNPSEVFPETGGIGATLYTSGGLLLMLFAGTVALQISRRRKEKQHAK